jgi:hypothetical protein
VSDQNESVGSVGEEAAKLFGALQEWARESGSHYASPAAGAGSSATSSLAAINEHIATGGEDCRYCPVCQAISAVRSTSPEVRQHLVSAATSLMEAVAGAMATHLPDQPHGQRGPGVQRIDLSGEDESEDD